MNARQKKWFSWIALVVILTLAVPWAAPPGRCRKTACPTRSSPSTARNGIELLRRTTVPRKPSL